MKRGNLLKAQHGFMLRLLIGPYKGTINWGILVAGVGGSGDPRTYLLFVTDTTDMSV